MKNQIWTIVLSIVFSFFIISTMAVIVSRSGLVYFVAYGKSQSSIMDESIRFDMGSDVREYLSGSSQLHYFNEQEKSHLKDVKAILDVFFHFSLFVLGLGISVFIFRRDVFYKALRNSALICIGFCTLLVLLFMIGFDKTFSAFHTIFFPQGNWQFPVGSELIAVFPLSFFFNIAMIIVSFILLTSFAILSFLKIRNYLEYEKVQ